MAKHDQYQQHYGCPVEATLDMIGGKWKGMLIYHLLQGTQRFNGLRRAFPGVTQRMLTKQLREMEAVGLVHREVFAEVPPRVEYSLTQRGESLRAVIDVLEVWGAAHALPVLAARARSESGASTVAGC